jgi:type IV fimbrial biogenesis protein FimT
MKLARGMTLIELMVTLTIVAILMGLAAPSFKRTIQSNNMSNAVNSFLADVRYARSEAMRRGGNVSLCEADAPDDPLPTCSTSAGTKGWAKGWVVSWTNPAGTRSVLRVQSAFSSMDSVLETGGGPTTLTFNATGRLASTAQAIQLNFGGGDYGTQVKRVVCVSVGGRARVAGDGSTSCAGTTTE